MDEKQYQNYINLLKTELVPALGCTEPISVALCSAKCKDVLGVFPNKIDVFCSGNIIKNVQGVTVPNSGGLKGIKVAALLGSLSGDPSLGLEVLEKITSKDREVLKEYLEKDTCKVFLAENVNNLYIKVYMEDDEGNSAEVVIEEKHTNISKIIKNGKVIFSNEFSNVKQTNKDFITYDTIFEFADNVKIEEIKNVLEKQIEYNYRVAQEGLKGNWGLGIGKEICERYDKNDVRIQARMMASAASDARMAGCSYPVVINSGSGNQGLTISLPIIIYAKKYNIAEDKMYRSLIVANLISILQKKNIGDLSAFCGATNAAAGAASGIAYMLGYNKEEISNVITNTLCSIGGMVCDGAKGSCAYKISLALEASLFGLELGAKDHKTMPPGEGIVKKDIESTIAAMGRVGGVGMRNTDKEILNIMLEK